MRRVFGIILALLFLPSVCWGVVTEGVDAGFVTVAPTANPVQDNTATVDSRALAVKFTSPVDATAVIEIGWYCSNATQAANFEVGIYDHDSVNNTPENLLSGASQTNAKGTTAGWKVATSLNITISPSTVYWLAVQLDDTATSTTIDGTVNASYKQDRKSTQTTLPSNWGTSTDTGGVIDAIYAVYTTTGGAVTRSWGWVGDEPYGVSY